MKRRICNAFLLFFLSLLLFSPVRAETEGSLLLADVKESATLIAVAGQDGTPTGAFCGTVEKLTPQDLTRDKAKVFYEWAREKGVNGTTLIPDENKEIYFPSLSPGWFLVYSNKEKAEFAPFLICIPMTVGEKTVYHIKAQPKIDSPLTPDTPSSPGTGEDKIPQTGAVLWPKYLLLALGGLCIVAGAVEVIRNRRARDE